MDAQRLPNPPGAPRVLVLQHMATDGPGYLATWLLRQGIAFDVFDSGAGQDFPASLGEWSALAVLGGEMSVNDPLPSLRRAESLIREAVAASRPVLGHCLGGQLLARALGGEVGPSPRPELGWCAIDLVDDPLAVAWFGDEPGPRRVFQWHGEAFTLPEGARRLAGNAACPNQAFAIGPHLGMQFHVEVDEDKLRTWFAVSADPHARAVAASLAADPHGAAASLRRQQALADRVYARWWSAVGARHEAAVTPAGPDIRESRRDG